MKQTSELFLNWPNKI